MGQLYRIEYQKMLLYVAFYCAFLLAFPDEKRALKKTKRHLNGRKERTISSLIVAAFSSGVSAVVQIYSLPNFPEG